MYDKGQKDHHEDAPIMQEKSQKSHHEDAPPPTTISLPPLYKKRKRQEEGARKLRTQKTSDAENFRRKTLDADYSTHTQAQALKLEHTIHLSIVVVSCTLNKRLSVRV